MYELTERKSGGRRRRRGSGSRGSSGRWGSGGRWGRRSSSSRRSRDRTTFTRVGGDLVQLLTVRNWTGWVRRARSSRVDGSDTERDVASLIAGELGELGARELAVEETGELVVLRCRLAVRDLERVGCVARLLHIQLGEADHLRVVFELLCERDHLVCCVLLRAGRWRGEESTECLLRDGVALLGTTSCNLIKPRI
jgi:hypothetical protein